MGNIDRNTLYPNLSINKELKNGPVKNYINTSVYTGKDEALTIKLHNTEIVKIYHINTNPLNQVHSGKIKLNHGGWQTVTTKRRMNEASDAFMPGGMGFKVYQKDFEWYIERDNGDTYHWEGQFITFPIDPSKESYARI